MKIEQDLKLNLSGTIGDKTTVYLDHDSQRQTEDANQIRLSYNGSEDEVVQSIQAGDVGLSIPSTNYTGDLPAHKGLFGLSTQAKVGGVNLYAVAAQEQSETQSAQFSPQTSSETDTIWDTDYLQNTFFRIDDSVSAPFSNLRVYYDDDNSYNNAGIQHGRATIYPFDPARDTAPYGPDIFDGYFDIMTPNKDYITPTDNSYIQFINPIGSNYTIGVSYSYVRGRDTIQVGGNRWVNPVTGDTMLILKIIKLQTPDSVSRTWDLEWRNVYRIGSGTSEIKLDSISIVRQIPGQQPSLNVDENGQTFLHLIGLDPDGDGLVQSPQLDRQRGYLICDSAFPFQARGLTQPDSIYLIKDPTQDGLRKYYFVAKYSTATQSYNLGQVDILDGSEKVVVNGETWIKGTDYNINYSTGELSFIHVLPPDAQVSVTYEYQPLFSVTQKTLLGTRAEWKFADNGKVGASVFYRTEGVPEDKPTLGDEPFRRTVGETDVSYGLSSDAVTSILDKMPLLRVESPTTLQIGGEGAVSLPDPNTRGAAWLDDFESSTITYPVYITYMLWQFASVPKGLDTHDFARTPLRWVNPYRIRHDSIFGPNLGTDASTTDDFLRITFIPDALSTWAGLMTCPSRLGLNLTDAEDLEAVFRTPHNRGRMHITVGTIIDEAAPRRRKNGSIAGYDGREHTEDKNQNGLLDAGEDTGLDTIFGADSLYGTKDSIPGDDGDDNYNDALNPDGTEGNVRLDGQDLTGSGWTQDNDYYDYSFNLTDTTVVKNLYNGWKTLRIPLRDSTRYTIAGSPRLDDIRLVRVWFDSFSQPDTIDLYSLSFTGSKWQNPNVVKAIPSSPSVDSAEQVKVSLISQKTDPNYAPPFDPGLDANGNTVLEQALKLEFSSLNTDHRAIIRKLALEQDDYRDYNTIMVYVHNDPSNPTFFLQIGSDSANYYEYRQPVGDAIPVPGRPDWYQVSINLDTLPQVKYNILSQPHDSVTRGDYYTIAGNPSLADVPYLAMGIENPAAGRISGNVWIDDIRLVGPRKDVGFAFNTSASLRLSDLATASLSYQYEDPNFRRFSEPRGVKEGGFGDNIGLSTSINLDRFLPAGWGISLPLNYSRNTSSTIPKFSSVYPDLRLAGPMRDSELGSNASDGFDLSLHKAKSQNRLLNYTLEALTYSWQHRTALARALLDSSSSATNSHALSYGISPDLKFKIGETEIAYFPDNISASLNYASSRSPGWHRNSDTSAWTAVTTDSSLAASTDISADYDPISDLSFSYRLGTDRDLTDEYYIRNINIGQESDREANFTASYDIDLGEILSPKLDYDADYTENRARTYGHYAQDRDVHNEGNLDLSADFDLPEALAELAGLRDTKRDKGAPPGSLQWFLQQLSKSGNVLTPISFDCTYDRNSDYHDILQRPAWTYQFGLSDLVPPDSLHQPASIARTRDLDLTGSTDVKLKDLDARIRYDWSQTRDVSGSNPTQSYAITWPDISLSYGKAERFLPKLLTTSSLSSSYQRRADYSGLLEPGSDTFDIFNRQVSTTNTWSPLLSWQATWKNKITTTLSANLSSATGVTWLDADHTQSTVNQSRSATFNLAYTFAAPQGIRIPGLSKLKFTSNLTASWGLTYGSSYIASIDEHNNEVPSENSRDFGTNLALSYSFSRSIDGGLTTDYTNHNTINSDRSTRTVDLNFWVLFKF